MNYLHFSNQSCIHNCMIRGQKSYDFFDEAKKLRTASYDLIDENSIYEYYNPLTCESLGNDNISWTTSLIINMTYEEQLDR